MEWNATEQNRPRRSGLVGPVLLILVGLLFLLNNLGLLSWSVWEVILRLWPILLIAVGLDLMFGRRSMWVSALVLLIVLVVAGVALVMMPAASIGGALNSERITQSLEGATRAEVEIAPGVGTLRIGAMPEAEGLIEGTVSLADGERAVRDFSVAGDTAHFRLRSQDGGVTPFLGNWSRDAVWDLKLNPDVPTSLKLNTGVGQAFVDLSRMRVADLTVNSGVGTTLLTLPTQGQFLANIEGGVGDLTITVPAGMAARVEVSTGIGDVRVDGDYARQGNVYLSPGYDTAQNRVDLKAHGGVGRITIQ